MAVNENDLGGRLPLLDPAKLEGDQKKLYDYMQQTLVSWAKTNGFKGETSDGRVIGPFNPFLHSVGITPGFLEWMQADSKHTSLSKRVHEIVILSVGAVWQSPYEMYSHSAVARSVGVPEEAIAILHDGGCPDMLSDEEKIAHRFARQLTIERQVDDDLYRQAKDAFGEVGLVDMTYLVGMYLMTCAMLNVFKVPAPE